MAIVSEPPPVLRCGLARGTVFSVGNRSDFVGSCINMAARLQGQSQGDDIVLSRAVADDPAVKPLLAGHTVREESVSLKGFDSPVGFLRVLP